MQEITARRRIIYIYIYIYEAKVVKMNLNNSVGFSIRLGESFVSKRRKVYQLRL